MSKLIHDYIEDGQKDDDGFIEYHSNSVFGQEDSIFWIECTVWIVIVIAFVSVCVAIRSVYKTIFR